MALESRVIQVVEEGATRNIPALSPKWCDKRTFLKWILPPPITSVDVEEWKQTVKYYNNDLHWLLKLPHHKFWSQVVHDKTLQKSLVSFLQESPRFYSEDIEAIKKVEDGWKLYQETYRLVFLTFLRFATHKESKENYITPEVFGSLIYEHFIFDIPKLMDLCILFGPTNQVLLNKMIVNIFTHQPRYVYDLEEAVNGLAQVFNLLLGQLGLDDKQATGWDDSSTLSIEELKDIIEYVTDVATTIWYLMDVYPPAAEIFSQQNIQLKLVDFYEKSIPYLYQQLENLKEPEQTVLVEALNIARKFLLGNYNVLLHSISVKPLLTENSADKPNCVEQWLVWLTCIMGERHFIVDYNLVFPIQDDIDLMTQMSIPVDNTRIDYVKNGVRSIISEFGLTLSQHKLSPEAKEYSVERVTEGAIDSHIAQVKELMPDLKDDFIQACLKHYDFSAESVINSILEGNLAPHLIEMQNTAQIENLFDAIPAEQHQSVPAVSKIKDISKKTRTKTVHFDEMRGMLDDKPNLKSVILERVVEQMASEYDDEYDDTYDGHDMGAEEPDDELASRRSFVVPRILRPKEDKEVEEEESEEEESTEKPRDLFVANPAELREQAEQRRLSRRGRGRPGIAPRQPRDVVGAPRGQGQDKDTTAARRHKSENKSRGANHNRRWQADRKRKEF